MKGNHPNCYAQSVGAPEKLKVGGLSAAVAMIAVRQKLLLRFQIFDCAGVTG